MDNLDKEKTPQKNEVHPFNLDEDNEADVVEIIAKPTQYETNIEMLNVSSSPNKIDMMAIEELDNSDELKISEQSDENEFNNTATKLIKQ